MEAYFKTFTKTVLLTSMFGLLGMAATPVMAEDVQGYCSVVFCSSSDAAIKIKQSLGLGDASLGWWDCRIQGRCQDLQSDIQKLKVNESDCTLGKLTTFREDISAINTKLSELITKFGSKGQEAVGSAMKDGLTNDLMNHYKQCYAEGFFKPGTDTCITQNCIDQVAVAEKLEVNKENCETKLKNLYPKESQTWDFSFEQNIVTSKLDLFRDKCVNESFIPAATIFDVPIFKKDLPMAEQCQTAVDQLNETVAGLEEDEEGCTADLYYDLSKQVGDVGESLEKLGEALNIKDTGWRTRVTNRLNTEITQHFVACESSNLFPPDKTECISPKCQAEVAKIEAFKVDKANCRSKPGLMFVDPTFNFEESIVELALSAYKEKCVDANLLAAANIYDIAILKKDVPFAKECQSMGEKLKSKVTSLKVNAQSCTIDNYNNINKQLEEYEAALIKLGSSSPAKIDVTSWSQDITKDLESRIRKHFAQCESAGLLSSK